MKRRRFIKIKIKIKIRSSVFYSRLSLLVSSLRSADPALALLVASEFSSLGRRGLRRTGGREEGSRLSVEANLRLYLLHLLLADLNHSGCSRYSCIGQISSRRRLISTTKTTEIKCRRKFHGITKPPLAS